MDSADQPPLWRVVARLLCLFVGGGILICCAIYLLSAWLTGPDWATVQGRVTMSGIDATTHTRQRMGRRSHGTYQDTRYRPDIIYHYEVDGRDYSGDGVGDGINSTYGSRSAAAAALAQYTQGPLTVYYDPANPERSALDTGLVSRIVFFIGAVGLAIFGIGLFLRKTDADDGGRPAEETAAIDGAHSP